MPGERTRSTRHASPLTAALLPALMAGLAASACAELPELGRCGNGVVEASLGEACDQDSALCDDQCRLVCVDSDEAPPADYVIVGDDGEGTPTYCPAGHTCGVDDVCRAPSGGFRAPTSPIGFAGGTVSAADLDADGRFELIGLSQTGIQILSGPTLATVTDLPTPPATGPGVVVDLDGDRLPDIAAPVEGGLALLRGDGAGFRPILDFAPPPVSLVGVEPFVATAPPGLVSAGGDAMFYASEAAGSITVRWYNTDGNQLATAPSCDAGPQALPMLPPVVARDRRQFALVVPLPGARLVVCHYQPGPPATPWLLTRAELASPGELGASPARPAVLANLDSDRCLELAYASAGGGVVAIEAGTGCALNVDPALLPTALPGASGLGQLLTGADLDGDGDDELVGTNAVLTDRGGGWAPAYATAQPWALAAVADLDGDQLDDVVAAATDRDDLFVLRGARDLGFAPYRVATARPTAQLLAGDFDGDGVGDVAQVERLGTAGDRTMLWFGSRTGPLARAVEVVEPRDNTALRLFRIGARAGIPPSALDGIDDLVVVRATAGGGRDLALLFGSVPRLLFTIHWPGLATVQKPASPNAVTAADLLPGGQIDLAPADISGSARLWLWDGADARADAVAWSDEIGKAELLAGSRTSTVSGRGPAGSHVFVLAASQAETGDPTPDTLIAGYRGGIPGPDGLPCLARTWTVLAPDTTPIHATVLDLGGDGLDELAVTFEQPTPHVVVYPIGGGVIAADSDPTCGLGAAVLDTRTLRAPGTTEPLVCLDVAAIPLGPEQLAISCLTGGARPTATVFALRPDGAQGWSARRLGDLAGVASQLRTGDVDGDGVLDLAAVVELPTGPAIQVLSQCEAARPDDCVLTSDGSGVPGAGE